MLLFRAKIPQDWLPKILGNLPEVLIDHAHLERKAATTSISLEKYRELFHRVDELNAIAIEELQHFQLVLALLKRRGIAFTQARSSPWISGLMKTIRSGSRQQVIDHLLCCSLIEGRSCEKFQCSDGYFDVRNTNASPEHLKSRWSIGNQSKYSLSVAFQRRDSFPSLTTIIRHLIMIPMLFDHEEHANRISH